MGWDDIGLHHPRALDGLKSAGAQTPHIDKLIKGGMSFTNFYATPLCAMGRAELLTGRDYSRTGNLFNSRGYDAFHLNESTAGNVMQQAGYITAHYGKWHNGRALGYEPWWRGFNESWLPTDYIHLDNLMRHNGRYVQTEGMMEQVLVDKMAGFLKKRAADEQPFFMYYAPYAIHKNVQSTGLAYSKSTLYFAPEPYLSRIEALQPKPGASTHRLEPVWAMLMYLDDVLGRLFDAVASSGLKDSTYIMLTADNGPGLPKAFMNDELQRLQRHRGGLRNHLAIAGPGVPSGAVDDTLLSLADVLPTIAELGNATKTRHMPWSGVSFANLLKPGGRATAGQKERFMFSLVLSGNERQCPLLDDLISKYLPDLGADRNVLKPQPMLVYQNSSGGAVVKNALSAGGAIQVVRLQWQSLQPHSFTKPVFQIGLGGWKASNVEASGVVEMSRGDVLLASLPTSRTRARVLEHNVLAPGRYLVGTMYRFNSREGQERPGLQADIKVSPDDTSAVAVRLLDMPAALSA
ncbi:alkaline-phosphatase-like protein [Scenedesmus sp. NREL 46B-D3]|nr:alkaline-phosphatase-like protein [Scenedesmus sp. NREL 46B-D3]